MRERKTYAGDCFIILTPCDHFIKNEFVSILGSELQT